MIFSSSNVVRFKINSDSSVTYQGKRKLSEISEITSECLIGLTLSEIRTFENCSVFKNIFLA